MKILITGITGFIGSHLSKRLLDNNDIYAIVRKEEDLINLQTNNITGCLESNLENLELFFKENKFDGIIHLASYVTVEHNFYQIDNIISSNISFPTKILDLSSKNNVKWFINTGTFWQHYNTKSYSPVNLYASTKQAFEDIAKFYTENYKIRFTTLKLNDTYGPKDNRSKIFNLWLKISKTQETLDMSFGEQLIDIIYIDDIIEAYIKLIDLISSEKNYIDSSYYISSDDIITLKQLSKIFEEVTNKKLNINWGGRPYRTREIMNPICNGVIIPNWKPKVNFREGIKKVLSELGDI